MQHLTPPTRQPIQHLLHPSDFYMPGHGLGVHKGYDRYAEHTVVMFRSGFLFSLLLTLPLLLTEPLLRSWLGYPTSSRSEIVLLPAILGAAVFFYGGQIFLRCAYRELQARQPGVMLLNTIAITLAFLYSALVTLGIPGHALWRELATLITILLLCHWIAMGSIVRTQGAFSDLSRLLPETAWRFAPEGQVSEVPLATVGIGDKLLIPPGTIFPADGVIEDGSSTVDESRVNGSARSVAKERGDPVFAGALNGEGSLQIVVSHTADDTALLRFYKLLEAAKNTRSIAQLLADRVALTLTFAVLTCALITLLAWWGMGATFDFTLNRMASVLLIAAPHALGLAIPLAIVNAMSCGARQGLLVRSRRGLEKAKSLDIVVFDKRGTLTVGEYRLCETVTTHALPPDEALRLAAAVECHAHHPLAQAIRSSAEALEVPTATDFQVLHGLGVQARVAGRTLLMGGPMLLQQWNISLPNELRVATERFTELGQSVIYLLEEQRPLAAFAVTDPLRPETPDAIAMLHRHGIEVAMITDETAAVAYRIAHKLDLDNVFSQLKSGERGEVIRELKGYGKRVAIVGSGHQEAMALTLADIGIICGVGMDQSITSGDVAMVRSDPRDVARLVALSKATFHKTIENIGWAVLYNLVAVVLASGLLTDWGRLLSPLPAAILMTLSVLAVTLNARRLRRVKL